MPINSASCGTARRGERAADETPPFLRSAVSSRGPLTHERDPPARQKVASTGRAHRHGKNVTHAARTHEDTCSASRPSRTAFPSHLSRRKISRESGELRRGGSVVPALEPPEAPEHDPGEDPAVRAVDERG